MHVCTSFVVLLSNWDLFLLFAVLVTPVFCLALLLFCSLPFLYIAQSRSKKVKKRKMATHSAEDQQVLDQLVYRVSRAFYEPKYIVVMDVINRLKQ